LANQGIGNSSCNRFGHVHQRGIQLKHRALVGTRSAHAWIGEARIAGGAAVADRASTLSRITRPNGTKIAIIVAVERSASIDAVVARIDRARICIVVAVEDAAAGGGVARRDGAKELILGAVLCTEDALGGDTARIEGTLAAAITAVGRVVGGIRAMPTVLNGRAVVVTFGRRSRPQAQPNHQARKTSHR